MMQHGQPGQPHEAKMCVEMLCGDVCGGEIRYQYMWWREFGEGYAMEEERVGGRGEWGLWRDH